MPSSPSSQSSNSASSPPASANASSEANPVRSKNAALARCSVSPEWISVATGNGRPAGPPRFRRCFARGAKADGKKWTLAGAGPSSFVQWRRRREASAGSVSPAWRPSAERHCRPPRFRRRQSLARQTRALLRLPFASAVSPMRRIAPPSPVADLLLQLGADFLERLPVAGRKRLAVVPGRTSSSRTTLSLARRPKSGRPASTGVSPWNGSSGSTGCGCFGLIRARPSSSGSATASAMRATPKPRNPSNMRSRS